MTKDELIEVIKNNVHAWHNYDSVLDAVDAYTSALLKQCNVIGSACEDACRTVVNGYEGDGMEQMKQRDEVFYKACKEALKHCL